jgi:uncharacterized damage-inducible protein DinB
MRIDNRTMNPINDAWLEATNETLASYRRMIDAAIEQLSDAELWQRPTEGVNSVAIILRHLGGNLQSRWTDFLTTDGEKPDRNRDQEFVDWQGDRASLLAYFDQGWSCLTAAIDQLNDATLTTQITIRGEVHTIPQALGRSITHIAYHAGQIVMIARIVHAGQWKWLTIAPGESQQHNERTWGRASSRGAMGESNDAE